MKRPSPGERPDRGASERLVALPMDRRRFLVLLGGAATYATLRPQLALARKLAQEPAHLQPWRLPEQVPTGNPLEVAKAVIAAAVLAPSHWNTQPWRIEVDGATLRLYADTRRALPVTDPDQRAMMVSLGASLENMLIALRAYGLHPTLDYFPSRHDPSWVATIGWVPSESVRERLMFTAIPERRTNRRGYDGRGIYPQNRAALVSQVSSDLTLHWLDERDHIRDVADLVGEAVEAETHDRRSQSEHWAWIRFGDGAARKSGDGVTMDALEYGGLPHWFAGSYFDPNSAFLRFGAGSAAHKARDDVRSAGALALLTAPRSGDLLRVSAGQSYQRLALRATTLGIAQQLIHAPISVERFRGDLLRAFGAPGEDPIAFLRLGHARSPEPSVRRSVAMVASFRNS